MMGKIKVAIVRTPEEPDEKDIVACVRKSLELCGVVDNVAKPNDTVLIKPNILAVKTVESAAITDPRICKAIADVVRERGAKPVIAESSSVGIDTEEAFRTGGYDKLRKEGYEVVDLKRKGIETVKVAVPEGKSIKDIVLPKIVVDADVIISVPKMKTHDGALVTLSLKNMKGVLSDKLKRQVHQRFGVFQGVVDLCSVVKPDLVVMDGITAMEGFGPSFGDLVKLGLIIVGRDPVATDAVASVVMGFGAREDPIVDLAAKSGLGVANLEDIEIVGVDIAKVQRRFKRCSEALSERVTGQRGFQLLTDDKTCTGCKNTILQVLLNFEKTNRLDELKGWIIAAGQLDELPDVDKERLLLVGVCLAKHKKEGVFVRGCPPLDRDLINAIKMEP